MSSGEPAFRYFPSGFIFDVAGTSIFVDDSDERCAVLGYANSNVALEMLKATSPTMNFEVGAIGGLPVMPVQDLEALENVRELVEISKRDWDSQEISWEFSSPFKRSSDISLVEAVQGLYGKSIEASESMKEMESKITSILQSCIHLMKNLNVKSLLNEFR
ncbi:MAG: hypothetical protein V9G25_09440 [Acidimicrobiia bacterium]